MAATEETHGALSLAQVEEELRSTEAYLTASQVLPPPRPIAAPSDTIKDEFGASGAREWTMERGSYCLKFTMFFD